MKIDFGRVADVDPVERATNDRFDSDDRPLEKRGIDLRVLADDAVADDGLGNDRAGGDRSMRTDDGVGYFSVLRDVNGRNDYRSRHWGRGGLLFEKVAVGR